MVDKDFLFLWWYTMQFTANILIYVYIHIILYHNIYIYIKLYIYIFILKYDLWHGMTWPYSIYSRITTYIYINKIWMYQPQPGSIHWSTTISVGLPFPCHAYCCFVFSINSSHHRFEHHFANPCFCYSLQKKYESVGSLCERNTC
jgi:hypothetical protein